MKSSSQPGMRRGHKQPKLDPARNFALEILLGVLVHREPIDKILSRPASRDLNGRDRAFAHMSSATVLRRMGEIDVRIGRFMERPLPRGAHVARNILRLACAELLYLRTPTHAAVSSAVDLAGAHPKALHYQRMINAILRRVSEEITSQVETEKFAPEINTPPWLFKRFNVAFGKKTANAIVVAHRDPAPLDIMVKSDPAGWAKKLGGDLLPTGTIRLNGQTDVTERPGYAQGAWWVQGVAAALPVQLLGQIAGKSVVDMCAAPGGKTLQLAAAGARVTALDLSAKRMERVKENLHRTKLDADIHVGDALKWSPPQPVDIVLLDAPCLSTGTIRRHPDLPYLKSEDQLNKLVLLQKDLLSSAARMIRPGGTLLYCVCSLEREEGEDQIRLFLEDHDDFTIDPVSAQEIGGLDEAITQDGMVRTLPSQGSDWGGLEGFFIARLKKK